MEAPAPAPAPASAPVAEPEDAPSTAQIVELFKAPSSEAGLKLLARCLSLPEDYEEDLRSQIWLDMLYGIIDYCKELTLTPRKAKAYLTVMMSLHAHSTESKCSKEEAFGVFTDGLLGATKGLPLAERFSLDEVRLLTEHATSSYLSAIKLHQLVFTEEQTVRDSELELFLQTPAVPPATDAAVDPDSLPPPEADDANEEPTPAPATADPAAEMPAAEAEPPAAEAEPAAMGDEALTAAIAATISSQVAAHQAQMAAEYAQQEQMLLDRVAALEAKLQ